MGLRCRLLNRGMVSVAPVGGSGRQRLLLAEEPTGSLDSASATVIAALLTTLVHDEGLALVLVAHDPDVAALGRLATTSGLSRSFGDPGGIDAKSGE